MTGDDHTSASERSRPDRSNAPRRAVNRYEEELDISTEPVEIGSLVASKHVESRRVAEDVPLEAEYADVTRVAAEPVDSGEIETLPDGSVSIPILEEELVLTKRLVVRERVVIRKRTVTEVRRVEADLRRERVDVEETTERDAVEHEDAGGG